MNEMKCDGFNTFVSQSEAKIEMILLLSLLLLLLRNETIFQLTISYWMPPRFLCRSTWRLCDVLVDSLNITIRFHGKSKAKLIHKNIVICQERKKNERKIHIRFDFCGYATAKLMIYTWFVWCIGWLNFWSRHNSFIIIYLYFVTMVQQQHPAIGGSSSYLQYWTSFMPTHTHTYMRRQQ